MSLKKRVEGLAMDFIFFIKKRNKLIGEFDYFL